jgi:hypothetical protein
MTSSAQPVSTVTSKSTGHKKFKPRATLDSTGAPDSGVGASNKVYIDNKGVHRAGDKWKPHGTPPNLPGADGQHATDTDGKPDLTLAPDSPGVYVDNKAIGRIGDSIDCGTFGKDTISAGNAKKVFAGDNSDFKETQKPDVSYVLQHGDGDAVTPQNAAATGARINGTIANARNAKIITSTSTTIGPTVIGTVDNTPPNNQVVGTVAAGNWEQYNQDNIPYATLMLTEKTSLATFTTGASLWVNQPRPLGPNTPFGSNNPTQSDNKHIKAQYGLTVPQILHNLSNLAKNVYEPIRERYPRVIVTNTFRQGPPGGQKEQAQHGRGQAMDLVFPGYTTNQLYDVACWIRDNVPFDQLLQEKCGAKIWIHISFYSGFGTQVPKQNRLANLIVQPYQFVPGLAPLS